MIAPVRGAIPDFNGTVEEGLPALRAKWILNAAMWRKLKVAGYSR